MPCAHRLRTDPHHPSDFAPTQSFGHQSQRHLARLDDVTMTGRCWRCNSPTLLALIFLAATWIPACLAHLPTAAIGALDRVGRLLACCHRPIRSFLSCALPNFSTATKDHNNNVGGVYNTLTYDKWYVDGGCNGITLPTNSQHDAWGISSYIGAIVYDGAYFPQCTATPHLSDFDASGPVYGRVGYTFKIDLYGESGCPFAFDQNHYLTQVQTW